MRNKVRFIKKCLVLAVYIISFTVFLPVVSAQTAGNLSSAVRRMIEIRGRAGEFNGDSYFPSEWEAAESQFAQALLLENNDEDVGNVIRAYNEAAAAYDRVFELAIPLYAQAVEDEIMAIREYLVTLGAKGLFPEYLQDADKSAVLALKAYEEKNYYSARDVADYALQKFIVLETAFNAWLLRVEILARGFAGYDPDNFDLGGDTLSDAMDAYTAGDLGEALEKAGDALSTFTLVLSTSWASYAELRASLAEGERLAALDMKTDIAAKEFFTIADSDNKTALALLESRKFEDAARLFIDAEAMYVIASITTLERRRAAAAAIRNADEIIQESDELLRNAGKNR